MYIVPTNKTALNGVGLNRAGRLVEAAANHAGLRLRAAEIAWGDYGLGMWLCCIGTEDGRSNAAARDDGADDAHGDEALALATSTCETRPEQVLEFVIDRRYGTSAISLNPSLGGMTFEEVCNVPCGLTHATPT